MAELPFRIGQLFTSGTRTATLIRTPNPDQRFVVRYQGADHQVSLAELIAVVLEAISAGKIELKE